MSEAKEAHGESIPSSERRKESLRGSRGVYKRGAVWLAVVEGPKDPKTGARTRIWIRERFRTRKEAEAARDTARDQRRGGIGLKPNKATVSDVLTRFIEHRIALGKLHEKAAERYRQLVKFNITPHIGAVKLRDLHKTHVTGLIAVLLARGRKRGEGGLSVTTVRHVHALLKSALKWAISVDLVTRNVADIEEAPQRPRPDAEALTETELARVLDAARGTRWETLIVLALTTGARRGELAAVVWDAVDFENKTLTVRASFSQTKTATVLKGTKTDRVRVVPLSPLALAILRERRTQYVAEKLAAGEAFDERGFVIADLFGRPYPPIALTEAFRELARSAGVEKHLHSLRHTCASYLIASGVDVRTVSNLLGHSTATTTLNVYAHLLTGAKEAAAVALDERLQAAAERGRKSR